MQLGLYLGANRYANSAVLMAPSPIAYMPLVNDLNLVQGTGPATFTRSTIATYIDKDDGLLKSAAIDTARFETQGVLIEGASTNQFTRSEEFDDAVWLKQNWTVTANNAVAPDGTTSMDLMVPTVSASSSFTLQNSSVTSGNTYTQTIFAKAGGYDFIQMAGSTGFNSTTAWANFNLNTGTVGNTGATGTASIKDMGGGIYRCRFTTDATATTSSGRLIIAVLDADTASRLPGFVGDTVSGVNVWGAQIEELSFASSYIPTTTIAVTREADNLSIPPSNIPAPTLDYSIAATVDVTGDITSDDQAIYSVTGETTRLIKLLVGLTALESTHGVTAINDSVVITPNTSIKVAQTVDVSDSSTGQDLYRAGSAAANGAVTAVTGSKTAISLGKVGSTEYLFGHIKDFRIFDLVLTPEEVALL